MVKKILVAFALISLLVSMRCAFARDASRDALRDAEKSQQLQQRREPPDQKKLPTDCQPCRDRASRGEDGKWSAP